MTLDSEELSYVDWDQNHILEAGEFKLWVGSNSAVGIEQSFELID